MGASVAVPVAVGVTVSVVGVLTVGEGGLGVRVACRVGAGVEDCLAVVIGCAPSVAIAGAPFP